MARSRGPHRLAANGRNHQPQWPIEFLPSPKEAHSCRWSSALDPTAGIFNNGSQAEMGFGMVDDWSPTHSLSSEACSSRCLALRPMPTWRSTVVVYFTSSLTTLMQEAKLRPLPVPLRTLLVPIRVPCHKLNIYYGIVSYRM